MTLEQIRDTPSSADEIDAKPHIIFVDDDENILRGLRRMLKSMSAEWGMAYASSGQEALALMSRQPFDVIVSDRVRSGCLGEPNTRRILGWT